MAKQNLVICSDGTWNRGGVGHETNVFRIFKAVDREFGSGSNEERPRQLCFHDDGVGTQNFKIAKIVGGAFGFGLSRNIRDAYEFLIRHYRDGDSIYLFGFSRGAFTVRSLSGLIARCGIVDMNKFAGGTTDDDTIRRAAAQAFQAYRFDHVRKRRTEQRNWFRRKLGCREENDAALISAMFRDKYSHASEPKQNSNESEFPRIRFLGVWDTVSALGGPAEQISGLLDKLVCVGFHEHGLASIIDEGYHALAVDEERRTFAPKLWDEAKITPNQVVQQVWFPGVHSNVGGGYPKTGLANVALQWMMERAEESDLRFQPGALEQVRASADVHDKLYDSRAGLSSFYQYKPRDIAALCDASGANLKIHKSVMDRIQIGSDGYAPSNVPRGANIVSDDDVSATKDGAPGEPETKTGTPESAAIKDQRWLHRLRQFAYMLFMGGTAVGVCTLLGRSASEVPATSETWSGRIGYLLGDIVHLLGKLNPIPALEPLIASGEGFAREHPVPTIGYFAMVVGVIIASTWARRRIRRGGSDYWKSARGSQSSHADNVTLNFTESLGFWGKIGRCALIVGLPALVLGVGYWSSTALETKGACGPRLQLEWKGYGKTSFVGSFDRWEKPDGDSDDRHRRYDPAIRAANLRGYRIDFVYIAVLGLALWIALQTGLSVGPEYCLSAGGKLNSSWLLPLGYMVSDYVETTILYFQTMAMDSTAMGISVTAISIASVMTTIKWCFLAVNVLAIAALAVHASVRGKIAKTPAKPTPTPH